MTRERAKQLLPVITAWAEGKPIQYKTKAGEWLRYFGYNPVFSDFDFEWRVEPQPAERWFIKFADGSFSAASCVFKQNCQHDIDVLNYRNAVPVRFVEVVE